MSAIGSLGSGAAAAIEEATGFGAMSSEEFVNILVSELANQDPFEPQDSAAILEQLSSLRNIESQMQLERKLESLVEQTVESQTFLHDQMNIFLLQNQLTTAGSTIGKYVEGYTLDGDKAAGTVTSVRVEDETIYVELDTGKTLPMALVTHISAGNGSTTVVDPPTTVVRDPVKTVDTKPTQSGGSGAKKIS